MSCDLKKEVERTLSSQAVGPDRIVCPPSCKGTLSSCIYYAGRGKRDILKDPEDLGQDAIVEQLATESPSVNGFYRRLQKRADAG